MFALQHGSDEDPTEIDFFLEDGILKLPGRSIPFGDDHPWWRIRVGEPAVQLETSPDGRAWTMQAQVAAAPGLRDAWLHIGLGCDLGEATAVEVSSSTTSTVRRDGPLFGQLDHPRRPLHAGRRSTKHRTRLGLELSRAT